MCGVYVCEVCVVCLRLCVWCVVSVRFCEVFGECAFVSVHVWCRVNRNLTNTTVDSLKTVY